MDCEECGRPLLNGYAHHANALDALLCQELSDAYKRGVRKGVEVAKELVRDPYHGAVTDWTDVDSWVREHVKDQ